MRFARGIDAGAAPLLGTALVALLLIAAALGSPAPANAAPESDKGDRGSWELVWRYDEANGVRNHFAPEFAEGRSFPISWRVLRDTRGQRLQFYDSRGELAKTVALAPGERAIASEDGRAWVVFAADSSDTDSNRIRSFRGGDVPLWEAFTAGEPLLLSPGGEALVLGARTESRSPRFFDSSGGQIQILGGETGETRGELPVYPPYVRVAGDGRKLAFLHSGELFLLGTNGHLEWMRELPIDNLVPRGGLTHLAAAGDLVVVCGTGVEPDPKGLSGVLHPEREEHLIVFDLAGREVWRAEPEARSELRFHYSCAISPDGSVLATLQDTERDEVVSIYDARTGVSIAENRTTRMQGARTLSVSLGGEYTALVFGDMRTSVVVWDRQGNLVFEGDLPYRCQTATISPGGLLVGEQWIVRIRPDAR